MANPKQAGMSLEMVKKHYFWGVVPLVLLIAFGVTFLAKGSIRNKFEEKKKAVESAKSQADSIASNNLHPNETTIEAIKKETNVLKKSVFEAWTLMYSDQKMKNRWPSQLSKDFLERVNSLKFRAPIAPSTSKQYLLEDYAFFIGNHLPELLKGVQRRRVQVQDYRWIESENAFYPVYVDSDVTPNRYYIIVTDLETGAVKDVLLLDIKRDILSQVSESADRDYLLGKEHEHYYREMDPWIVNPKDFITYGGSMLGSPSSGGMGGGMGMGAGMGGGMSAGGAGMPGPKPGGGARGAMDSPGGGAGGNLSADAIPGDNIDPAVEQLSGNSQMDTGMGGAAGGGGMRSTGTAGAEYPGLPPYSERRRVVGNVDWTSPEIYGLPTWNADTYPTSIEIWYAQETLWVYEALISIVAQTNKEAADNVTIAPIKCIEEMLIGQPASAAWQSAEMSIGDLTGSSSSMMGGMGGMGDDMGSGAGGGMPGMGGMDGEAMVAGGTREEQALNRILFGRYLDSDNTPLLADKAPPFAEFNRMPVCLRLVVDQRRIPDILVNCANCSMPIDIKHIRICPDNAVPFSMPPLEGAEAGEGGDLMGGGMGGMGMGGPGGPGAGAGAGAGANSGSRSARGAAGNAAATDVTGASGGIDIGRSEISQTGGYGVDAIRVEIYGIINIFNEPNIKQFGTGGDGEGANTELTEETLNDTPSVDSLNGEEGEEGVEETEGSELTEETAAAAAGDSEAPDADSLATPAENPDAEDTVVEEVSTSEAEAVPDASAENTEPNDANEVPTSNDSPENTPSANEGGQQ
ncbi:MAG: hypothetical protein Q4G68_10545 [Planctomycetia bacterium]|nr:hypothetical protein [Planctomycetia bacterium]